MCNPSWQSGIIQNAKLWCRTASKAEWRCHPVENLLFNNLLVSHQAGRTIQCIVGAPSHDFGEVYKDQINSMLSRGELINRSRNLHGRHIVRRRYSFIAQSVPSPLDGQVKTLSNFHITDIAQVASSTKVIFCNGKSSLTNCRVVSVFFSMDYFDRVLK